jgi:hypothetical protein
MLVAEMAEVTTLTAGQAAQLMEVGMLMDKVLGVMVQIILALVAGQALTHLIGLEAVEALAL